jgi:hypothetical protein
VLARITRAAEFKSFGGASTKKLGCQSERSALRQTLKAGRYGMCIRLMTLIEPSLNLTHDFTFLSGVHESHLFRIVQADRPGMLQAGHGGDR